MATLPPEGEEGASERWETGGHKRRRKHVRRKTRASKSDAGLSKTTRKRRQTDRASVADGSAGEPAQLLQHRRVRARRVCWLRRDLSTEGRRKEERASDGERGGKRGERRSGVAWGGKSEKERARAREKRTHLVLHDLLEAVERDGRAKVNRPVRGRDNVHFLQCNTSVLLQLYQAVRASCTPRQYCCSCSSDE